MASTSSAVQPDRAAHLHQHHHHHHSYEPRSYYDLPAHSRSEPQPRHPPQPMEPARPLESRPPPSSRTATMPDTFVNIPIRAPLPVHPDARPQGPSLPGVRDILSPTGPAPQGYGSWWSPVSGSPSDSVHQHHHRQTSDHYPPGPGPMHHHQQQQQPPPAPPSDASYTSGPQPMRRYDTPNIDHDRHRAPASTSPYSTYSDPRSASDVRSAKHAATRSGGPPLAGPGAGYYADETRPPPPAVSSYDRGASYPGPHANGAPGPPPPPPPSGTGADSQKKYIGVETTAEGTFHCYEGGYRIPTHVDGEQVNPAWGLTKANKPRKRLALACLDCREKKVKCEPGITSCMQCEKAKRPCRRAAQPPQDEYTTHWPTPVPSAAAPYGGSEAVIRPPTTAPPLSIQPPKRRPDAGELDPPTPMKRPYPSPGLSSNATVSPLAREPTMPSGPAPGSMSLDEDPYYLQPRLTLHLVELYLANSDSYGVFPRQHFMRWLVAPGPKTETERAVLYAMLAFGSSFDITTAGFGDECLRIATDAVVHRLGRQSLYAALTRMLLGLHYLAKGHPECCWDHIGAGMTTMVGQRLCTEQGCAEAATAAAEGAEGRPRRTEFDLSREQLIECQRRVFWAMFVLERHGRNAVCVIKPQDIFLRLPCPDEAYERGTASSAPLLSNGIVPAADAMLEPGSAAAPAAWLIAVAAIVGDVFDFANRAMYRDFSTYTAAYEPFYDQTAERIRQWCSQLPPYLRYSDANLDEAIRRGYGGSFVAMHSLHHLAAMHLNRCARHAWLSPAAVARNIQMANAHGFAMLRMLDAVRVAPRELQSSHSPWTLSTPLVGHAAVVALDVVTAGGHEQSLRVALELAEHSGVCLRELSRVWAEATAQWKRCETRYYQLQNVVSYPNRSKAGAWLRRQWGLELPTGSDLPTPWDCTYGVPDYGVYHNALSPDLMSAAEQAAAAADAAPSTPPQRW